jgi:thymidylate kinase
MSVHGFLAAPAAAGQPTAAQPVPCIEVVGIDGAGKSTVVGHLANTLGWRSRKVRPFTPDAVTLDLRVSGRLGTAAADSYRACLLASALLAEAADLSEPTVYDRYVESARMWWAVKNVRPLPEPVLARLPGPTAVLFLDVPVDVGQSRRLSTTERSPAEETRFLDACRAYLRGRARSAGWMTIDATAPLPDVLTQVADWVPTIGPRAS